MNKSTCACSCVVFLIVLSGYSLEQLPGVLNGEIFKIDLLLALSIA